MGLYYGKYRRVARRRGARTIRTGIGTSLEPLASISVDDLISMLPSSSQSDFRARKAR